MAVIPWRQRGSSALPRRWLDAGVSSTRFVSATHHRPRTLLPTSLPLSTMPSPPPPPPRKALFHQIDRSIPTRCDRTCTDWHHLLSAVSPPVSHHQHATHARTVGRRSRDKYCHRPFRPARHPPSSGPRNHRHTQPTAVRAGVTPPRLFRHAPPQALVRIMTRRREMTGRSHPSPTRLG